MKTIQKEKVTKSYYNVYVANDGTEFSNEDECRKYDESARGVIFAKYGQLVLKQISAEDIHGYGSCDETIELVKVGSEDDANTILQALLFENSHFEKQEYKEWFEKYQQLINRAKEENDILFVSRGYEMDGFYILGTRKSMMEALENIYSWS